MAEPARRSAGLARELVEPERQKYGRELQPIMKVDAFAPPIGKSEPPRATSEPPKGPGLMKAPSPSIAPESALGSTSPGLAGCDSVPLQSGRRVRFDQRALRGIILLVDDEALLLKTTRRMLEQRGFRVETAADAAAAIELALHTPDIRVLLTDLSLPGMDGRELARRLRWTLPELRVLFMSGFDAETSGLDARQAGDGFLSKPFTARELEDRVSELLGSYDSDAATCQG
jgi:CheY-like chemotaxis protein